LYPHSDKFQELPFFLVKSEQFQEQPWPALENLQESTIKAAASSEAKEQAWGWENVDRLQVFRKS
jgi:hypothetical protein